MRPFLLAAAFFLGVALRVSPAAEAGSRSWTDLQQRTITAAFVRMNGDQAVLRAASGQEFSVAVTSLSPADRQWLAQQGAAEATAVASETPLPSATEWPRTVLLKETPNVRTIREDAAKKEFIYESDHYQFLCDSPLGTNLVREFSRVFEATRLVNCLLPLDLNPQSEDGQAKFRARIFTNESDYLAAGGPEGSSGVYSSQDRMLMLPLASLGVKMVGSRVSVNYSARDYATLIHEITHQMMNHWLWRLPVWYLEGSAVYVELAKYDNGRFSFLQQERRLQDYLLSRDGGSKFRMIPLARLLKISGSEWLGELGKGGSASRNYASAAALTYYFYHLDGDGKGTAFQAYLKAVGRLRPGDDFTAPLNEHLLRGRDYEALQADIQKSFRRAGIAVEFAD